MEPVEPAIPSAILMPNLMGSDVVAGARGVVADAKGCETARFADPKNDKYFPSIISQRDSECNANGLESSSLMKKVETGSCRNTIQLSAVDSMLLAAGAEGKRSQKKERKVPRINPGCFKIPQTLQPETSISPLEDVDMKDVPDENDSHLMKSPCAEKYQPLKQKSNLNSRRGDRKNARVPLAKHDGLTGYRSAVGGSKVFGAYGLKTDVPDVTKLTEDISLKVLLDGSYKCPIVAKEKAKRPANTSDNILHLVRKAFSIVQPQRHSQASKQYDEMDVSYIKELSTLPNSNLSMASNLDVDEDSVSSDWSCTKVQESWSNTEAPPNTSDLPLHHPRDVIEKLAISPSKDLESLLQDAAKPATFSRCNEARPGKPLSRRAALSTFSWSHNHYGHSKISSDSVKVAGRSFCQGRWIRIRKTAAFLGGGYDSYADLGSLAYDHSLVPSGSVEYILPKTQTTSSKISGTLSTEQTSSLLVCALPSLFPPDLRSPKEWNAAQALYDIANSRPNETAYGIIKWPKQPSQKAMKARKSKSIQGPENLFTPKYEVMFDNTVKFMDNAKPLKKLKLSSSEKRDHPATVNAHRPPQFWSSPRSSRSSPTRSSKEPALDANKHHINGSTPKPLFMAPPRRVSEKTNHSQQHKVKKVLQMDWNRGKGQL